MSDIKCLQKLLLLLLWHGFEDLWVCVCACICVEAKTVTDDTFILMGYSNTDISNTDIQSDGLFCCSLFQIMSLLFVIWKSERIYPFKVATLMDADTPTSTNSGARKKRFEVKKVCIYSRTPYWDIFMF